MGAALAAGEGSGLAPESGFRVSEARRPSAQAAGSQQFHGRRRLLPGWSCRPARVVAEEPQKRTSSAAEPTSAWRFLGPWSPEF